MVKDGQLASAIRSIGAGGEPFSSAALRGHLGITTDDRRTFASFNDALRIYCKNNSHSLERVGKNRYRLLDCEPEVEARPRLRHVVIRITRTTSTPEPEPRAFSLRALAARLWLSLQRAIGGGAPAA
jgi:hypothetical protein